MIIDASMAPLGKWKKKESQECDAQKAPMGEVMVGARGDRAVKAKRWRTHRYAVRAEMLAVILKELRCPEPCLDAFADQGNMRFPRYWGSGGERSNAWAQNWNVKVNGVLWMNPPFEDMLAVIKKIERDGAAVVLLAPDWRSKPWFTGCFSC